jgi:hypothetical protein
MHVVHAVVDEAERSVTGMLAAIDGVALIALGLVVAWRAPAQASWKRRWGKRGAIAAGALAVGFYVLLPIGQALVGARVAAIAACVPRRSSLACAR